MKKNYSTARELRAQAKDRLKHRWGVAIFAFLIALLLGGVGLSSFQVIGNIGDEGVIDVFEQDVHVVGVADMASFINEEYADDEAYFNDDADHSDYIKVLIYALFIAFVLLVIGGVIVVSLSLYNFFVAAPLTTGYMRFNLDLFKTRRKEVSVNRLLYGFKNGYSRSAGAYCRLGLKYVGVALRYMFVPLALLVIGMIAPVPVEFILVAVFVLFVAYFMWVIANIKVALTYSMSYYLLADHPEMTGREALKTSKAMMNGHKWRLLRLRLSFLGWIFLSFFTFGIGLIWVGPYMQAADAAFYRELAKGGKKQSFLEGLFH